MRLRDELKAQQILRLGLKAKEITKQKKRRPASQIQAK